MGHRPGTLLACSTETFMKRAIVCIVLTAFLGCTADEPPGDTPGDTVADTAVGAPAETPVDDPLVAAGRAAVDSLTPLAPGTRHESYFEVKFGPEDTVGYVMAALEAIRDEDQLVYRYTLEFVTSFSSSGARLIAIASARLKPNFEPIEIEMTRTTIKPDGDRKTIVRRAAIASGKVVLTAEAGGEHRADEVPIPPRPFIYGIEMLAQRFDYRKHDHFTLREFDLNTGGAGLLAFKTADWTDGTQTVLTHNASGVQSYQFWYDREGKLLRWGEPSLPVIFVRTTKERALELKARFSAPPAGDTD